MTKYPEIYLGYRMRKFIDIMETIQSESLVEHIAEMVRQGYHEGYGPYWKLNADPRILEDEAAMHHISELISAGFTSGHHPAWDLKVIEGEEPITADGENAYEVEDRMAKKHPELDEEESAALEVPADVHLDANLTGKHKVVAVHQKHGEGQGWYECSDDEAELFVVEDENGEPVESYPDRNSAEAHAHTLDTSAEVLDEVDLDPTDGPSIEELEHVVDAEPSIYSDDPDYKVEIAAIHERGHKQDEAFRELEARGISLTDDQLRLAGR